MSDLYCQFGSNWGGKAEGESILDIFYKYNIAFAGLDTKEEVNNCKNKFKAGTKIAVSDGTMVKAVGIAEEDFDSLDNLKIDFLPEEKKRFAINKGVLAVKVKLYKLEEGDYFQEKSFRRRFSNINNDNIKKEIDKRLKKYSGEEAMEKMKEEIKELLIQNKNLILTGAPGTGKTYLAKQIAEEMIIRNYYEKNKNELEKYYNECEELRKQFIEQFPIGTLKSISIDDYCIGKGNKNSFCYWIEFKLRNSGFFDCGTANSYLLYYDTNGNLKNTSIIINNDELIKEIGEAIYKMATEKEYNGDLKFKGDKTTIKFAMKIYNSYNPYYYFPIFSSDYMNKICEIFNIVKDKNPYKQNLNIKEYFDKNFKDINPVIMKEMLIRNFFKNDDDFKKQCEFVQFHPSYDYTDFVEGLRPKNDNGNIGFERKDGVFKAFCKKALKNLKDSKKDISTLNYDEIIKKYLEDFYNDIEKEITTNGFYEIYGIGGGIAAPIIDIVYKEDEKEAAKLGKAINKELDREIKEEAENAKEFAKELKADIESRE